MSETRSGTAVSMPPHGEEAAKAAVSTHEGAGAHDAEAGRRSLALRDASASREADAPQDEGAGEAPRKPLSPAARRALAEAEERRRAAEARAKAEAEELGGRGGLDPARYGDWEIKGIACDF